MDIQRNNRLFTLRVKQHLGTIVSGAAKVMIVIVTIGSLETYAQQPQKPTVSQKTVAKRSAGNGLVEAVASRKVEFATARPAQRPVASKTSARSPVATKHSQKISPVGRQSVISKAAHGEIIAEPLPEVLHGGHISHHGHAMEVGCGVEGCTTCCDSGPVIGTPFVGGPACGVEPACGFEPGCGMEACGTCGPTMYGVAPLGCDTMMCDPAGCDSMACAPSAGWFNECYPLFVPIKRINWSNFEFFAGTHAFSGPANFAGTTGPQFNRDGTASFGIHEGFNFARPSFLLGGGISSQFGLRATHSNASGAEFTPDSRNQIFLTGGFFRRVDYGLQGGVVVDYLNDKWYYNASLTQIRAQIGWKHDPCNEFGYIWTGGLGDDVTTGTVNLGVGAQQINVNLEPVDQHRIFYRRYFKKGGSGELFAGTTDESDGLLGASLDIPLIDGISMRTSMVYLNPNLSTGQVDSQEETWNLSWGFVWFPCGTCARSPYDRPMFEVADNGSFMMDRLSIP